MSPHQRASGSGLSVGEHMKYTVLVVDDERIVADTLGIIFQKRGFECQVAYTGVEAMSHIQNFCPDLLLCDITMPGMDGLNLASYVVSECPECRVMLLTGHYTNLRLARQWAQEHPGRTQIMTKPVSPNLLLEEAEALLQT